MEDTEINGLRIKYKEQGYALLRYDDKPVYSYPYDAPWITDTEFSKLYDKIYGNTLVDRPRCYALYMLMSQIKNVEGDILELGTWRGGTAGIFTTMNPDRTVYLADTFTGVVKSSDWEHYTDKRHDDTSEEVVVDLLEKRMGVSNYEILKGIFPEDTGIRVKDKQFAFVYLDADVYLSTKDAFDFVWNNVALHGIVAFDDYGMFSACEGISRFVHEIKDDKDKLFISNANGQAYIIKI